MARLPAVSRLAKQIRSTRVGRQQVDVAADYLVEHRSQLDLFDDPEHLAISIDPTYALPGTPDQLIRTAKVLGHHIDVLRASIARELWSRQIFIDSDLLDEVIFYVVRDGRGSEPVLGVLEWIRDARATRPGMLIFPLHSLGVQGAGFLQAAHSRVSFANAARGYAVSPQTNDLDRTLEFLNDTCESFGIHEVVPADLIRHWRRSRSARWLERNPLLVIRTVHLRGSYYGGEWLLMSRVRATTGLLAMLAALQPKREHGVGRLFSSRSVNNWQTLDIHHYLTLFASARPRDELDGQCIPIHTGRTFVAELSDLAIDIDPIYWQRHDEMANLVHDSVEAVYTEYLRAQFRAGKAGPRERTVRKLFESMGYFRRSLQGSPTSWSGKVALATSFELLLLDHSGGIAATLTDRTRLLLKGTRGTLAMQGAVHDLYRARSALVHAGDDTAEADLALAREAYVRCFVQLGQRLDRISDTTATPIRDMVVDV